MLSTLLLYAAIFLGLIGQFFLLDHIGIWWVAVIFGFGNGVLFGWLVRKIEDSPDKKPIPGEKSITLILCVILALILSDFGSANVGLSFNVSAVLAMSFTYAYLIKRKWDRDEQTS
jgi:Na+-driven multidrug efflux pump